MTSFYQSLTVNVKLEALEHGGLYLYYRGWHPCPEEPSQLLCLYGRKVFVMWRCGEKRCCAYWKRMDTLCDHSCISKNMDEDC